MRPPSLSKIRSSVQQEKSIARELGGRRVAGSGAMPGNKGDVRAGAWLVEAKQTRSPNYQLKLSILRKIEAEALKARKLPVLIVEMSGRSFAVLDLDTFLQVANAITG